MGHPAVVAWSQLSPERTCPTAITTLQGNPDMMEKATVYLLEGAGPGGGGVIAKRCGEEFEAIERTIYEELLPQLPVSAPRYYGRATDGDFSWLFLEDVGREPYSPDKREHRVLSGRWLSLLHTAAARIPRSPSLPDRGPRRYLEHLRTARATILKHYDNPALDACGRAFLKAVLSQLEALEERWGRVEEFCHEMPKTVVHGDFIGKNVRVRAGTNGLTLLPFDWEEAGWGVPAVDLAQSSLPATRLLANPDLSAYQEIAADCWTCLDQAALCRLANYGKIFRCLAAFAWIGPSLVFEDVEWPLKKMQIYFVEMMEALRTTGPDW